MSVILRSLGRKQLSLTRNVSGSFHEYMLKEKAGENQMRKPPCPHEALLLENDGRYPPHLKIDLDHPENWPKHFPPFYESRRPTRWPLPRALLWAGAWFLMTFGFLCPSWLFPLGDDNFPVISNEDNWVRLAEHPPEERLYQWQEPLIDDTSDEAYRARGFQPPTKK